ncbi:hypothetical protein ACHAWF_015335 [Thalassiosira exigua]
MLLPRSGSRPRGLGVERGDHKSSGGTSCAVCSRSGALLLSAATLVAFGIGIGLGLSLGLCIQLSAAPPCSALGQYANNWSSTTPVVQKSQTPMLRIPGPEREAESKLGPEAEPVLETQTETETNAVEQSSFVPNVLIGTDSQPTQEEPSPISPDWGDGYEGTSPDWGEKYEGSDDGYMGGQSSYFSSYQALSEDDVTHMHKLLQLVTIAFEKHNITYFAVGGTHLGAVRNRPPGQIRWDDDMDLGILDQQFDRVKSVLESLPDVELLAGFGPEGSPHDEETIGGWQLRLTGCNHTKKHYLDIFSYAFVPDYFDDNIDDNTEGVDGGEGRYRLKYMTNWWPNSFYSRSEAEHPVDCPFWDLVIKCPNGDPMEMMTREHGAEVMTTGKTTNHNGGWGTVDLERTNLNEHNGYFPAMNRELMNKLGFG